MIIQPISNKNKIHIEDGRLGLFIGGIEMASDYERLKSLNIRGVLTTEAQQPISYANMNQILFHYVVPAKANQDVSHYFCKTNQFIKEAMTHGNVLVQSFTGQDLAPVFVIAYLMKEHYLTVDQAYQQIQGIIINISPQHYHELLQYERTLCVHQNSNYSIRDNNHISQFTHLSINPPSYQKDLEQRLPLQNKWDHLMKQNNYIESQMDIQSLKREIKYQAQFLQEYQLQKSFK